MHFCGSLETQKRKTVCPCQELNAGSSNLQHIQYTDWAIPACGVVACKTKLGVFLKTSDLYRILEGEDSCLLGCHAMLFGAGVTAACSTGVWLPLGVSVTQKNAKSFQSNVSWYLKGHGLYPLVLLITVTVRWMNECGALVEWYWQGKIKSALLHHKFHTDWSGIEPEPVRWEAGA